MVRVIPPRGGRYMGAVASVHGLQSNLDGSCGAAARAEAVFQWTPKKSGRAVIRTCSGFTSFDTVIYVRQGSCLDGAEAGCAEETGCHGKGRRGSRLELPVTAGETYYIVVDGAFDTTDRFKLRVRNHRAKRGNGVYQSRLSVRRGP
jgi:hypothetical protein